MVNDSNTNEEKDVVLEDELPPEEIDLENEEESVAHKLSVLRNKLKACEEEKRLHLEELQRTKADFLNSKKRLEEQFFRDKERATDKLLTELFSLTDIFDTAMANTERWNAVDKDWRVGIEAIYTKLEAILQSHHIETVHPIGEEFNPMEHEAVSSQEVTEDEKVDTVVAVLQKGFKRNEMILRPARVVVGTK